MKVTKVEEIDTLPVGDTKGKHKCHCCALLTPHLAEEIQSMDLTIGEVFFKIVEAIKASITPSVEGAGITPQGGEFI